MSEYKVEVIRVGPVQKHDKADNLEVTSHLGYPVVIRTGEFKEGDLAVYVPITALVPAGDPRWSFLGENREIEAKRLRGVFSMGILTAADPGWEVGRDVAAELGIVRAEPPEPTEGNEPDPGLMPTFTDLWSLRACPDILAEGEEVRVTEKIEGETARYVVGNDRLYCGSARAWKSPDGGPVGGVPGAPLREHAWWEAGRRLEMLERLRAHPGVGIFGELYGDVAGMKYDATSDRRGFRMFGAIDTKTRAYFGVEDVDALARSMKLPLAPELYRGPWRKDLRALAEGKSRFASHLLEGFVVEPVIPRWDPSIGRVILKYHGEGYLLSRKKRRPQGEQA